MREFVFALEFDPGTNPVADILAAHSETRLRSLSCHVTAETLWRVDHVTGSEAALDAVVEAVTTADYYADCLVRRDCEGEWETRTLDRSDETLILYSYWNRTPACTSIPHLAVEHFGNGLIFETTWASRRHEWRIIAPGDATYRAFHEAIEREIGETTGVDFVRVGDTAVEPMGNDDDRGLTPEQDEALRAAVKHGYYETPREIGTYELAEELGIPGSTLSYRLRRAEATLATEYVDDRQLSAHLSGPDS